MAVTYDWYAPYWNYSGGASPNPAGDARGYWVVSYEQNAANMTTTVYVNYRCQIYNSGSYVEVGYMINTAYIDGTSLGSKTSEVGTTSSGYSFIYQGTNSKVIQHNADGSASFTFRGKSQVSGSSARWTNVQTIYLPNIAVSPTVSINGAGSSDSNRVTIGNNISVTVNNTQGRSTTVTYPGGSTTVNSNTSVSVQIPTSLINSYTNTRTPQGTVTVSNSIGSNSVSCYMYISDSYKPVINTFSFNGTNSNYTRLIGMYVQNLTTPKFTGTATFQNGASISSSKINISNYPGTGSLNFSGNNFTYTASVPFSQSGTHTATSQITDSRSIPSDIKTSNSIEVIPYQSPSVNASYVRCDYEGNPDESSGKYMKLTLNYKYYLIWYSGNPSGEMNYFTLSASGDGEYFDSYEADPSQGRSGNISCSYSKSFILDNGKEQTTDTYYQEGKRYFTKSGNTYTVINYTPGAAISGTVYEGKQFALTDSKDIYYRFSDITGTSQLISIRTSPAYTLISRLHGDAGHGVTLGQVATETGFQSYLDSKFHNKLEIIKNNHTLDVIGNAYTSSLNMNDLPSYGTGLFTIYATSNAPLNNNFYHVTQIINDTGLYIYQHATLWTGERVSYERRYINGSWEAWNKLITNGSFWINSIAANTTTQTNSTSTWNVPETGIYILGGIVTLNYYGESGRELYFKVNAGNTQLSAVGGVINTASWGKSETYFWVGYLVKDTTVWFSVTNSVSGKQWAFSGGSFYWIRIS